MKKLSKLVLHKAVKMTVPQMKHITGGYGGGYGSVDCGPGKEHFICYTDWKGSASDTWGSCCGTSAKECENTIMGGNFGDYIEKGSVRCYSESSM